MITMIDQRNIHLFQPLLYQVATAALSPADIAMPIRRILQRQGNAKVMLGCGGRVSVQPDLSLPRDPTVFVIGDTALVIGRDAKPVSGIASAAKQEGAYVAKLLIRRLTGKQPPPAFHYRNDGNLATIGRKSGVVDFGWIRLSGVLAWLIWGGVRIFFLIGFRNRMVVALDWLWCYFHLQARRPADYRERP
jgi:NADH dehydrogenase FAD-containing subunit